MALDAAQANGVITRGQVRQLIAAGLLAFWALVIWLIWG